MNIINKIIELEKTASSSVFSEKSTIWHMISSRSKENKSDATDFLSGPNFFRESGCMPEIIKGEESYFKNRFRGSFKVSNVEGLKFPKFGNPEYIIIVGIQLPITHVFKLSTFSNMIEILDDYKKTDYKFKFAEIGAGWGAVASIFIGQDMLSSYTDIDIPETLVLGATYLTNCYPKLSSVVQSNEISESSFFNFCMPNFTAKLDKKFDIVLNEASLAEMPKETALAYIDWVADHLDKDGIFFWNNGRNRSSAKDVTQRMSEYNLSRFKPIAIKPQRGRAKLQNDAALFIAMGLYSEGENRKFNLDHYYDILLQLTDIGITDEVLLLYKGITKGKLDKIQLDFISACNLLFSKKNIKGLIEIIKNSNEDSSLRLASNYLVGINLLLKGRANLAKKYLDIYFSSGLSPMALAFTAAIYIDKNWKIDGQDPIFKLTNNLTNDFHFPSLLKKEKLSHRELMAILKKKIKYPWIKDSILIRILRKFKLVIKRLLVHLRLGF